MPKGILKMYSKRKVDIKKRLQDFRHIQAKSDKDIFAELAFCTLTPQSKALNCWSAVLDLKETGLLYSGNQADIANVLQKKVRFHNNKAKYIVENREKFFSSNLKNKILSEKNQLELREFLVENIKGYGYKEASHFLRNIGLGEGLAILDRHIMKNLAKYGAIKSVPKSLTKKKYFEIECCFQKFAEKISIPMAELDLLFWSQETGEIFK